MKSLLIIFFSIISQIAIAQQLLGYVTEQNSGKKTIANVNIKSAGASPTTSADDGRFMLKYQNLSAGSNVIIRAEKEGWEIVNVKEMNTFVPANPNEKPLKIIICEAGKLAKVRSEYYDTFEENLLTEFTKLKAKYKDNKKELARLEEDYSRIRKQLDELADEYSRINLDYASEKELQAIELFKAGKYEEFIALKKSIVTEEEADKAITNKQTAAKIIANADSTIELYYKSQKDIAKALILQNKFKEVEETYLRIYKKDTTNFVNTYGLAYFLQKQNQYDGAIQYYQRALRLAKTEPDVAMTQNNLGILYQEKNDYDLALNYHLMAEDKYQILSIQNNLYSNQLAEVQNCLGVLLQHKKDLNTALNYFEKSLNKLKEIDSTSQNQYIEAYGNIENNIGTIYCEKGEYILSKNHLFSALKFYEQTNLNTYENKSKIADIYNNLGLLFANLKDSSNSLFYFKKSIDILSSLYNKNKIRYFPAISKTLINMGYLFCSIQDYNNSLEYYHQALKIIEDFLMEDSLMKLPLYANLLNNIAVVYKETGNNKISIEYFEKSKLIFEKLVENSKESYEIDLCSVIVSILLMQKDKVISKNQQEVENNLNKAKNILLNYKEIPKASNLLKYVIELERYFATEKVLKELENNFSRLEVAKSIVENLDIRVCIINNLNNLIMLGNTNFAYRLGSQLSRYSYYLILNKQFDKAEKSVKEAINPTTFKKTEDYDAKIEWANTYLALALLFQGKYAVSENIYLTLKDKPYNNATYKETFLADLDELEKAGITHTDVSKIRELLKK